MTTSFFKLGDSLCLCSVLLCWQSVPQRASAEIIFNSFRSDGGSISDRGYFVGFGQPVGTQFIVPDTGVFHFDSVDLAVRAVYFAGGSGPASARVTLRKNNDKGEPGEILDAIERYDIGPTAPTTYSFHSESRPLLEPNTPYWIVVENLLSNAVRPFWLVRDIDFVERIPLAELQLDGKWLVIDAPIRAMRVHGSAVPEPYGTPLLALGGSICLIGGWFSRTRCNRASATPSAASPSSSASA